MEIHGDIKNTNSTIYRRPAYYMLILRKFEFIEFL